ncbi:MAG: hypothetical protein ACRDFT_00745 [bacterium]
MAPLAQGAHEGANLFVIFNDVLLKQDGQGHPAPDVVNRFVGFLVPAAHSQTGEAVLFMLRILAAHPESIPGRYKNSLLATVVREQMVAGTDLESVCSERFDLREIGGGTVELRLRFRRGVPSRLAWPTTILSAADPGTMRLYRSEALNDVVKSVPAGIDRIEQYSLRVTVPEMSDLFDGAERLISITAVPWFVRQEYGPSAGPTAS